MFRRSCTKASRFTDAYYEINKRPIDVHYLNDTDQTAKTYQEAKDLNEKVAEKIKEEALPVLYCNLGRINSSKLNILTENFPKVKFFGISAARLSKVYIESGKLLPPGYVLYHSPVHKMGIVHLIFLVAREYEHDINLIESYGSLVTISYQNDEETYFLTCCYGFNKGSELFNKGFNGGKSDVNFQFNCLSKWLNFATEFSGKNPHIIGGDFNLDFHKPRQGESSVIGEIKNTSFFDYKNFIRKNSKTHCNHLSKHPSCIDHLFAKNIKMMKFQLKDLPANLDDGHKGMLFFLPIISKNDCFVKTIISRRPAPKLKIHQALIANWPIFWRT